MNARQTVAGLLMAVVLAASAAAAHASPLPDDPGSDTGHAARTASLLRQLRVEYADTQSRSAHNEIVLVLNAPTSAFG